MDNYLDFVEEYYKHPKMTQYEKVLVQAARSRDMQNMKKPPLINKKQWPYTLIAFQEMREGKVVLGREVKAEPLKKLVESVAPSAQSMDLFDELSERFGRHESLLQNSKPNTVALEEALEASPAEVESTVLEAKSSATPELSDDSTKEELKEETETEET